MDKQKQIEEIEKNRVAELRLFYDFCKYNGCEEKTAEDCERCYFNKVYFRLAELEGDIRKGKLKEIPEGGVVLTEEAYSDLLSDEVDTIERDIAEYWATQDAKSVAKELHKDGYRKLDDHAIFVLRKAKGLEEKIRKETAEKFARLVEFHSVSTRDENGREMFTISALGLKEILHEEFGIPYDEICKEISDGKV